MNKSLKLILKVVLSLLLLLFFHIFSTFKISSDYFESATSFRAKKMAHKFVVRFGQTRFNSALCSMASSILN